MRSLMLLAPLAALVALPAVASEPPEVEVAQAAPDTPGAMTYAIDTKASELYVLVWKDPSTLGAGLSHDHVVLATGWSGSVTWSAGDAGACAVSIDVPVSGLQPDLDAMRQKMGYDVMLTESQRDDVKSNLQAFGQLNMADHPMIRFRSTSCSGTTGDVKVKGTLEVRGKTKAVEVPMKVSVDGGTFGAKGSFTAKATDFGFEPYTALFGQLKNKDEMKFSIVVKAKAN